VVASILRLRLQPPLDDAVADGARDRLVDEVVGPQAPGPLARQEGCQQRLVAFARTERVQVMDEFVDDHAKAVGRRLAAAAFDDGLVLDQRRPGGPRPLRQGHQVHLEIGHFLQPQIEQAADAGEQGVELRAPRGALIAGGETLQVAGGAVPPPGLEAGFEVPRDGQGLAGIARL